MDDVKSNGLDKNVHIRAGVTPLNSLIMAEGMKFYVPGVDVPDTIYDRMKNASDPKKEGYEIALKIVRELKNIKGVNGVHITALFWEDIIPSLVEETGIRTMH